MAISEKEYVEYIKNFCKENQGKRVIQDGKEDYIVYDSPSAILADRVRGIKIERIQDGYGRETEPVAISNESTVQEMGMIYCRRNLEPWGDRYENTNGFGNNFNLYMSKPYFTCLELKNSDSNEIPQINGHLTYDGICAYLALAPEKYLLANRDAIADEIARNAREQMEYVEKHNGGDAQRISDIGNKYIELKCVAREVLVQAQERIDAQENMADNENLVENLTSGEVMQKLNDISFVSDDEVQE